MVIFFLIALFSEGVRMPDSNETELEEAKGKQDKVIMIDEYLNTTMNTSFTDKRILGGHG